MAALAHLLNQVADPRAVSGLAAAAALTPAGRSATRASKAAKDDASAAATLLSALVLGPLLTDASVIPQTSSIIHY